MRLPKLGYEDPVRVCNPCFNTLTFKSNSSLQDNVAHIKVVSFEGAKCGKSSLIYRFVSGEFLGSYYQTEGAAFHSKKVKTRSGKVVFFEFWDTGGQERYWTMAPLYYKEADIVLLCYDPSDRRGMEFAEMWYDRISQENKSVLWVLAGLKSDLPKETHKVKPAQVERFIVESKVPIFVHTSSKDNVNVEQLFNQIAELVVLGLEPPRKKKFNPYYTM